MHIRAATLLTLIAFLSSGCALLPASLGGGYKALAVEAGQSAAQGLTVEAIRKYESAMQDAERSKATPQERIALLDPFAALLEKSRRFAYAESNLSRAAELEEQAGERETLKHAERLEALALMRYRAAKFDRLVEAQQEAVVIRQQIQEPDDPAIIESLLNLASYQELMDRPKEAVATLRQAVELGRQYAPTGSRHEELNHYAVALLADMENRNREALSELMKVLSIKEASKASASESPPENLPQLWLRIALQHSILGNPQRAREALEHSAEEWRKNARERGWMEGTIQLFLACQHAERWEISEAEIALGKAQEVFDRELSRDHFIRAAVLTARARLDQISGNCDSEERNLTEAMRIVEAALGRDHSYMADIAARMAELRLQQGRYFEAEPLMNRVLEIRRQHERPNSPLLAAALANLGIHCMYEGRIAESLDHLEEAVAIWERAGLVHHYNAAFTRLHLGWIYQAQGRTKEAERPIREGVADIREAWGTTHRFYLFGLNVLHEYLLRSRAGDEAVEVEREADAILLKLEQIPRIKPCAGFAERQTI